MTASATESKTDNFIDVRMGKLRSGRTEVTFRTLLGSCVGLVLFDPVEKVGGVALIMLPASDGRDGSPGKFVDTAIPELIFQLEQFGAKKSRMTAKIVGGANMFASDAASAIGDRNLDAIRAELQQRAIPIAGSHCGGIQGRRMMFSVATGRVTVQVVGADVVEI